MTQVLSFVSIEWLKPLFQKLIEIRKTRERELQILHDTFGDPFQLAKYYIEPYCQQHNPADYHEEEAFTYIRCPVFTTINEFLNREFITRDGKNQMFILADAGVGKTSLLVMMKLFHITAFWPTDYECLLLKLGHSTLKEIAKISNRGKKILLLDALDEDPSAWGATRDRINEILPATENFRRVIISCRTQYFPDSGGDPFERHGRIQIGGFICPVIYLSLFDDKQVEAYLDKRFPHFSKDHKLRCIEIVNMMGSLRFRPLLLSRIEDILESDEKKWNDYTIYKALVSAWLLREEIKIRKLRKASVSNEGLWTGCMLAAELMQRSETPFILEDDLKLLVRATPELEYLSYFDLGGRSLLNRNSDGAFRFSHYSIQEFLIAHGVIRSVFTGRSEPLRSTSQIISFITKAHMPKLSFCGLDLSGSNLNQLDLTRADFSKTICRKADFGSSVLSDANFSEAILEHASFAQANLSSAIFEEAKMAFSLFNGSKLQNANLENANLEGAKFSKAILDDCRLGGATMKMAVFQDAYIRRADARELNAENADFRNAVLKGTNFENAKLSRADFTNADLNGVNFQGADLRMVNFKGTNLRGFNFRNFNLTGGNFPNLDLTSTVLSGATLKEANFEGANLSGLDFSGMNFEAANFEQANLENVNFEGSNLSKAIFAKCRMANVNLNNANLSGATFTDAELSGATIISADLRKAGFASANLSRACLKNAYLQGANFGHSNLSHANLSGLDFQKASFVSANFYEADLSNVNATQAKLQATNLKKAILENAILNAAFLEGANLDGAKLRQASLNGAILVNAKVRKADLTQADFRNAFLYQRDETSGSKKTSNPTDFTDSVLNSANFEDMDLTKILSISKSQFDVIKKNRSTKIPEHLLGKR